MLQILFKLSINGNSLTYQGNNQHDDTSTPSNLPLNDDEDEQLPELTLESESESEDDEEEDDQNLPGRKFPIITSLFCTCISFRIPQKNKP